MKAIETRYKGYRFRSRLEARWAVFFDAVGLRWEYEPEGLELAGGLRYLPDFYLPDWKTWIEVKPAIPFEFGELEDGRTFVVAGPQEDEFWKAALATEALDRFFILCGTPGVPQFDVGRGKWSHRDGAIAVQILGVKEGQRQMASGPVFEVGAFAMVNGGATLDLWPYYVKPDRARLSKKQRDHALGMVAKMRAAGVTERHTLYATPVLPSEWMARVYFGKGVHYDAPELSRAYAAARSARFEHGEIGLVK